MNTLFIVSALLIGSYILLMVIRVAFSHNVPERIVALDTINTLIITLMIVLGVIQRKALYIDIGIVYGIISFIGTLYIARYLIEEKK
ncbi:MAG TPA: monovalent cation/H+ antiporter complex subunit F [Spirochaetota bacterium]|mgnify:FL=1|nr:monovalent cation/H+ antiporter complex subunit F [Spirochaetota bacterium]HPJ38011.1 monovalent cation/H+ antiporter complex subunit F [Spirochaetota bacterium]HPQ53856.1 monovalent cation/H+ antiporter complex subunit F [Spirochaetota bacterium]